MGTTDALFKILTLGQSSIYGAWVCPSQYGLRSLKPTNGHKDP